MMMQALEKIPDAKDLIRTETALSRFPIHKLSKRGNISIDIKTTNEKGELKIKWKVSYNSEYGQPTALAYKIDTLIINRRIEKSGTPVPKLIELGSLREIAEELGYKNTGNTERIKNALLQNVGALISAKFSYKTKDNTEREIEIADTRYGVIFTGEKLPNGKKANVTCIYLHDLYRQILDTAQTRPLDYDYLKALSPMTQRFYELLSYQIYGAIKNKTMIAKMRYSEFCTYAPQARFYDWEQVRPQMYHLHKPHLKSGYIQSVECKEIRADDGTLDWIFYYKPGHKADAEYKAANPSRRLRRTFKDENQIPLIPEPPLPELVPDVPLSFTPDEEKLIAEVRKFGVSEKKARELVKTHKEAVEREIVIFPERIKGGNIKNQSGLLIKAVEEHYTPPETYFEKERAAEATEQQKARAKKVENCLLCDSAGWRMIKTKEFPRGAAKRCTHDPNLEKDEI
jgi:hypothetical protein